jgi:hypothetical protein
VLDPFPFRMFAHVALPALPLSRLKMPRISALASSGVAPTAIVFPRSPILAWYSVPSEKTAHRAAPRRSPREFRHPRGGGQFRGDYCALQIDTQRSQESPAMNLPRRSSGSRICCRLGDRHQRHGSE